MHDSLLGDRNSESREGSIQVSYAGADERQSSGDTDDSIYDNMGGDDAASKAPVPGVVGARPNPSFATDTCSMHFGNCILGPPVRETPTAYSRQIHL